MCKEEIQMPEQRKLYEKLVPKPIVVEKLLLDPNNPRFCAFRRKVSTSRITEEGVQKKTLADISKFGVNDLKESMLNVGFLPIDRIVAVPLGEGSDYYVTIEGNRRIAAIKSILQDIEEGLDVNEDIIKTLKTIDALILDGMNYDDSGDYQLLVQGLRHISGVKSWKPYQQAKAFVALVDDLQYSVTDAAKTLGMGRSTASWMEKAFYAFEDMRKDEEVELPREEDESISYFSYFVELLKDVSLRSHFGWTEEENKFKNRGEILKFYKWIGLVEPEEEKTRQIPGALDVRKLFQVIQHPDAKRILESGGNIYEAIAICTPKPTAEVDYTSRLIEIYLELINLPSHFVKRMTAESKTILQKILDVVKEHLGT